MKKAFGPKTWLFPRPVVLVSARGKSGRDTIVTLSWAGIACSEPAMLTVAIRKSRFSHKLISETGEFVANMPTAQQLQIAEFCGTQSGAEVDKFQELNLTREKAEKVEAPMIAECPVNLECRVRQVLELGTHDLFIAEILAAHADESVLGPDGGLNDGALNPLVWQFPNYYSLKPIKE
jgi:flavin reductase (DIM6/NTAB) family NADH-FMN oxidoreductase RutF